MNHKLTFVMKKIIFLIVTTILFSCNKKEPITVWICLLLKKFKTEFDLKDLDFAAFSVFLAIKKIEYLKSKYKVFT